MRHAHWKQIWTDADPWHNGLQANIRHHQRERLSYRSGWDICQQVIVGVSAIRSLLLDMRRWSL